MKKAWKWVLLSNVLVAVIVVALTVPWHARAQVATTTVSVGLSINPKIDAGKFLSVPACSLTANCISQLQLCNENNDGSADSAHCIFIAADGQNPYASYLWMGVSETTPNSTGGTSTTPYGFATVRVSVPNDEVNIVP